jgi:hypothetical protein
MSATVPIPPTICYLCGLPLAAPTSADHAPMKQLFAPAIRKKHAPQLLTIEVHDGCNKAYQLDEDYFVHTLMPFARQTYAGRAIYDEVLAKFRVGKKAGLTRGVLNEFEPRPSGLILPGNKVVKRFQGKRLQRVAWKMVRGLYFHHHGVALPDGLRTWVSVTPIAGGEQPPEHFLRFMEHSKEAHGAYPGVFSYRFDSFVDDGVASIHYWALLIWDSVLVTVMFHDPSCACCRVRAPAPELESRATT